MKILVIFIDMLRNGVVSKKESNDGKTRIWDICCKMGGICYDSCYTTAPDTYRSLGSFWSSKYPKANGVDNRNKKEADFLKYPQDTMLGKLIDNGYEFNAFLGAWGEKIGIIPNVYDARRDNLSTGKFLREWLDTVEIGKKSFTFINLEDLHFILNDEGATEKNYIKGEDKIVKLLSLVFDYLSPAQFDDIILFSDHGFHYVTENRGNALDQRRSNIFLFWHRKDDEKITIDKKLCSIMDIYPTILNECKLDVPSNIEGIPLESEECHEYLLLEDHGYFYAGYIQPICEWAVIDGEGMHFIREDNTWKNKNGESEKLEKYTKILLEKATGFNEYYEIYKKNEEYGDEILWKMQKYFSDGEMRTIKTYSSMEKLSYAIRRRMNRRRGK